MTPKPFVEAPGPDEPAKGLCGAAWRVHSPQAVRMSRFGFVRLRTDGRSIRRMRVCLMAYPKARKS